MCHLDVTLRTLRGSEGVEVDTEGWEAQLLSRANDPTLYSGNVGGLQV